MDSVIGSIVKKEDSVEKDADPIEKEGSVGKD